MATDRLEAAEATAFVLLLFLLRYSSIFFCFGAVSFFGLALEDFSDLDEDFSESFLEASFTDEFVSAIFFFFFGVGNPVLLVFLLFLVLNREKNIKTLRFTK